MTKPFVEIKEVTVPFVDTCETTDAVVAGKTVDYLAAGVRLGVGYFYVLEVNPIDIGNDWLLLIWLIFL